MTGIKKVRGRELFDKIDRPQKIVAPMVDQSELAWRILSRRYGATLAYTPMFHAKLFATSPKYRKDMWCELDGDEKIDRPLVVQFCANDADYLLQAAKLVQDKCDAVDLNLGCPQGIAKKGHYGSFLMDEWDLVHKLIRKLHDNLDVPVTAKIRIFPEKEKTLEYAKTVLDAGAQFLTVHGRLREQKGQKSGLADWDTIKYLRENLPQDTVFFANGNLLYPEDISRCLDFIKCDAIMSAEGNLYNPGIFNAEDCSDKDKVFPRVDKIAREYFEIVKAHEASQASHLAMKSHLFKILRPFLPNHTDIRASLASLNAKAPLEVWESKVIAPVEKEVRAIFGRPDIEEKDQIVKGELELWGGSYYKVPYWRCQPYFRPVNGVTADKRVVENLKRRAEISLEGTHEKEAKIEV
ncbi:DUS1 (YML080W) [Zygosaccharomyces parabailii]|uniref:tRNA-dihydrouridine(16/17) synthase [NAD(P)(+)] n=1 Tax=Zygosaccharomyces bailii (strain CLIB 213 / ATCC 58445 / CBS 680 / BCRC 21525 / NBRC 1098 / NCYC 1416 / NRRL Y-2227) TaxID=1333698 RepID=A0A8J2TAI9_ZYGB2|nr:DUS1 (YML080W) [Zygosaccharomyces parabailii]CDF91487.1 ZYBA0S11-03950g1_1 [Zygosaccharomyces bailii CLIB 213]CDH17088.1 probable tRNA-dihydrouridine(16/17) synthase [NAD(P)(+)] [Zygosaccharomyces bailii ISA1307]SJM86700.1 probable tRNA-dihydrouridine(16/17) synthase [NAD(P)(+)] [Zygosaccharomyces bailii]